MSEEGYPVTPPNGTINFVYLTETQITGLTALLNGEMPKTTENVRDFLDSLETKQRIEASYVMLRKPEFRASVTSEDVTVLREALEGETAPYLRTLAVAALCIVAEHAVGLITKEDVETVAKAISDEKLPQNSALLARGIDFMEFIAVSTRQDELLNENHVELLVSLASRMKDKRTVEKVLGAVEKLVSTSAKNLLTDTARETLVRMSSQHGNPAARVLQMIGTVFQRFAPSAAVVGAVVQGTRAVIR